jgi:hypothetical protein
MFGSARCYGREVQGLSCRVARGVLLSTAGSLFMMQHERLTFVSICCPIRSVSSVSSLLAQTQPARWGLLDGARCATLVGRSTVGAASLLVISSAMQVANVLFISEIGAVQHKPLMQKGYA